MNKFSIALLGISFIFILGACDSSNNDADSNDNQPVAEGLDNNNTEENSTSETNNAEEDNEKNSKMKDTGISEFELEVEYTDGEYEAEIEKSSSGEYGAELEDELNNNNLKDDDAFNHIYNLFKNVDVSPDSNQDKVFEEFLNAFDLTNDYEEIEVEITFDDGSELEYEEEND